MPYLCIVSRHFDSRTREDLTIIPSKIAGYASTRKQPNTDCKSRKEQTDGVQDYEVSRMIWGIDKVRNNTRRCRKGTDTRLSTGHDCLSVILYPRTENFDMLSLREDSKGLKVLPGRKKYSTAGSAHSILL